LRRPLKQFQHQRSQKRKTPTDTHRQHISIDRNIHSLPIKSAAQPQRKEIGII
jgi:hypothetical protein